jgi:regulator of cell morphogenesis and NO signaling
MPLDRTSTVATIVLDHPECAPVLQHRCIDYCCRGGVTVGEACAKLGIDAEALFAELEQAIAGRRSAPAFDPRSLSTAALVDEIVAHHHAYLRRALPFVQPLAEKVGRVHGDHDARLRELSAAVRELAAILEPHLDEEERALFPALLEEQPDPAVVARELRAMHEDHLAVGAILARIRGLAGDFAPPEWACTSYRTLLSELAALEGDVLRHVHLENHVLMPRFDAGTEA